MSKNNNNALVALMNSPTDFEIAKQKHWYRIPVGSAPPIVKERKCRYIAFYHTKKFKAEQYTIQWYGKITKQTIVSRTDLFPNERQSSRKFQKKYYKMEFSPLQRLPNVIVSSKPRRLLFIPTTFFKLIHATNINQVFSGSHLEEKMWKALMQQKIGAEREFYVPMNKYNKKFFRLDFAIFCKKGMIDLECNGFEYHGDKEAITKDKFRNVLLTQQGWQVLRFTTEQINYEMDMVMTLVQETIAQYGGLQNEWLGFQPMVKPKKNKPGDQLKLF